MAKQLLIKEYLDYLFYQTKCPTSTLIYFWLGPDLTYLAINAGSIWPLTCSMYCRYISRQVMIQSRWWNFLDKNSKSLNFSDNHGQKYWDKTDRKPTPPSPLLQCWFQYVFLCCPSRQIPISKIWDSTLSWGEGGGGRVWTRRGSPAKYYYTLCKVMNRMQMSFNHYTKTNIFST